MSKILSLPFWEPLSWVDPSLDYGWCWEFINYPELGFPNQIVVVRGGGGAEMYIYDTYSDSGFVWFRNAPWGVSSGAALMNCPELKYLFLLRGNASPDFASLNLTNLLWTTLTSAPWSIGSSNTTSGPIISAVHPCRSIASVPTVTFTDTGGNSRTTNHYIFVMRGTGSADFAIYSIEHNVWGTRAPLPWSVTRGMLIWAPEWNAGKIIAIRTEGTRDWAVYDIATNTWTTYTYGGGVVSYLPASVSSGVYNKGIGGRHLIIFPSRVSDTVGYSGAIDIVNNVFIHGIVPRYYGDASVRWPRHNSLFVVIDGEPYIYHYAGFDRRATFARCLMSHLR